MREHYIFSKSVQMRLNVEDFDYLHKMGWVLSTSHVYQDGFKQYIEYIFYRDLEFD